MRCSTREERKTQRASTPLSACSCSEKQEQEAKKKPSNKEKTKNFIINSDCVAGRRFRQLFKSSFEFVCSTLTGTNFRGDSLMFLSSALHFTAPSTCRCQKSRFCSFVLHFSYSVTFSNLSFSFFSASSCREHKDSAATRKGRRGSCSLISFL